MRKAGRNDRQGAGRAGSGRLRVGRGRLLIVFLLVFCLPLVANAGRLLANGALTADWRSLDWSSAGLLPAATSASGAMVRIYCARTGDWRGIFAVHCWIVTKGQGAAAYDRYEVEGWGRPVEHNRHPADGRWSGNDPVLVAAIAGDEATRLIPQVLEAIAAYPYAARGDYRIWPGPNSNTFVAWVMSEVPGLSGLLPPTAIGKDYPVDGDWVGLTPSGTGFRITLYGLLGLTAGWQEGFQFDFLGVIAGIDIRRPALLVPGFGRVGMPSVAIS